MQSTGRFGVALTIINVRRRPGRPAEGLLNAGGTVFPCALGRGGMRARKREGDGGTPVGRLPLLHGYRRSRLRPVARSPLGFSPVVADLGWCDAPADRNYNRPVRLPYPASHERMRRSDPLYDVVIVLGWNIRPRRRNAGSAIFLHHALPGLPPTEGCVAVSPAVMARLLPHLSRRTVLSVIG